MKNEAIRKILEAHSIPCYEQGLRIYADTMIGDPFEEVDDLTGYSKDQIYEWLGY